MVSYPKLSEQQQQSLPALLKPAVSIPAKFEDSTHQLWHCETVDGPMVLKVCSQHSVQQSVFWQGMNTLFAVDFPNALEQIGLTHQYISQHGKLTVPDYIAAEKSTFVLSQYLHGMDVSESVIADDLVIKLAEHLAALHQQTFLQWGKLDQAELSADAWSKRLQQSLRHLTETSELQIDNSILQAAVEQAKNIEVNSFVPIMLDLRWDQLRLLTNGQLAVIDMDAFAIGPKELELVLLEYLLSAEQMTLFQQVYQSYLPLPDLSNCRLSYRLLLFLMNVLGETELALWMTAEARIV